MIIYIGVLSIMRALAFKNNYPVHEVRSLSKFHKYLDYGQAWYLTFKRKPKSYDRTETR